MDGSWMDVVYLTLPVGKERRKGRFSNCAFSLVPGTGTSVLHRLRRGLQYLMPRGYTVVDL